jgi:hypothetical protein
MIGGSCVAACCLTGKAFIDVRMLDPPHRSGGAAGVSVTANTAGVSGARSIRIATVWLAGTLAAAVYAIWRLIDAYLGSSGYTTRPHHPFGADFVNVWTTGRLVVSDAIDAIYRHQDFMAYADVHR